MRILLQAISLSVSLFILSCSNQPETVELEPDNVYRLDEQLREISGLTFIDSLTLAALQDELGIIYFLDPSNASIKSKFVFGEKGDYEGLAYQNGVYWVLRSDGDLFRVSGESETRKFKLNKSGDFDFEGLCYDSLNRRLLIACKEHKSNTKNIFVYGFLVDNEEFLEKPVFKISKKEVGKEFFPSGIALHPNGEIFILSASNNMVAVINRAGKLLKRIELSKKYSWQVEGIAFDKKGNLYVSNEEKDAYANLLRFEMKADSSGH